ncbi:hypothetical protein BZG24_28605, partial [Escherichia coli]|uniref:hypothetical protein n=1 Tax=Escherichia coli TaxID=562 RepID=UPI0022B03E1A
MKTTRLKALLLTFASLFIVFVLAACGNADSSGSTGTGEKETNPATSAFAAPTHLNVALFWLGTNLDPAVEWNGWTLTRAAIGETLVQFD